MKELIRKSKEHLDETGMNWWQHFCHVWYMSWGCTRAIWFGALHSIIPGIHAGTSRNILFKEMLEHQLETRPELLTKGK